MRIGWSDELESTIRFKREDISTTIERREDT